MALEPGTRLGPYEVTGPLGAGGMGEVYRARDTRLPREVAIKILPDEFAGDAERRRRFEDEARAVATLSDPHIVTLLDVGHEGGLSYLVLELLEGETLRAALGSGPLRPRRAAEIAADVAAALAAAHAKSILHRDLKPENVFLTRDGHAKVLDFGLAKLGAPEAPGTQSPTATRPGHVLGTYAYMSPEQARGQELDARSDIFSFGALLYEIWFTALDAQTGFPAIFALPSAGGAPRALLRGVGRVLLLDVRRSGPARPPDQPA
jgi:serine/threonine protein kinase